MNHLFISKKAFRYPKIKHFKQERELTDPWNNFKILESLTGQNLGVYTNALLLGLSLGNFAFLMVNHVARILVFAVSINHQIYLTLFIWVVSFLITISDHSPWLVLGSMMQFWSELIGIDQHCHWSKESWKLKWREICLFIQSDYRGTSPFSIIN